MPDITVAVHTEGTAPDVTVHAHTQSETIHLTLYFPDHEPRESDPHYPIFNACRKKLKEAGKLICWVCGTTENIQLHHDKVEFALQNGIDVQKFALDHPQFDLTDDEKFFEFVEGEGNLLPLCVTGDASILMSDGSLKEMSAVRLGDEVIGHDQKSHLVTGTANRIIDEELVCLDGLRLTADHLVWTQDGWRPAGTLTAGVMVLEVFGMRGEYFKILDPVVGLDSIDMVDDFGPQELPPEVLLHQPPVEHDWSSVHPHAHVAHFRDGKRSRFMLSESRLGVQVSKAAIIRAELLEESFSPSELSTALPTDSEHRSFAPYVSSPNRTASAAASVVSHRYLTGDEKRFSANNAGEDGLGGIVSLGRYARWRPINHVSRSPFSGRVYDIAVSGSSSFIANGIAIHNCALHHVGHQGIHVLPMPCWGLLKYEKTGLQAFGTAGGTLAAS